MNSQSPQRHECVAFPEEDGWCDLWHAHVDWNGDGNHGSVRRNALLNQLFQLFDDLEAHIVNWTKPVQQWAVIYEADSSQDAVYMHTQNPNRDNFPYAFDGVEWDVECPAWLAEFVDERKVEFGRSTFNGMVTYWIRLGIVA